MNDEEYEYRETHKHLTFELPLSKADVGFWMLLGEACSKCEHIASVPLKPRVAEDLQKLLLAKGAWATTSIEGNTLTEDQALKQLTGNLKLPPSQEYLAQEVQNIIDACNQLADELLAGTPQEVSEELIVKLNGLALRDLNLEPDAVAGVIREHSVVVGKMLGAPAKECSFLLRKLCTWLNGPYFQISGMSPMAAGIIKAITSHLYINWIHAFGDGNGRTARLIEFYILICSRIPKPAAHLLSNHYNATKSEYYRQLDLSFRKENGYNPMPFLHYALQGFVDGLKMQLSTITESQLDFAWTDYVNEKFEGRESKADIRKRNLAFDLSAVGPTHLRDIRALSSRVSDQYAQKTARTIIRDILDLDALGLVYVDNRGIVTAQKKKILTFLPERLEGSDAPKKQRRRPGPVPGSKNTRLRRKRTRFV
jgi:Fic family protein